MDKKLKWFYFNKGMGQPGGAAATYTDKVLGYSPIAYWRLNETSGTTADNAEGTAARDGTYSGVALDSAASPVSGDNAPLFDGTNADYVDVYSSSLNSVFDGAELTISVWIRVFDSGVWSDGANRVVFWLKTDDAANNIVLLRRNPANGRLDAQYIAGGTAKTVAPTGLSSTDWIHAALTASASNDRFRFYLNGSQSGADQTGLGTWAGALQAAACNIGVQAQAPVNIWHGYIAHMAIFASELSAAQVADLATV